MTTELNGLIKYFHLEDWWLIEFIDAERMRLIETYGKKLVHGKVSSTSLTEEQLLKNMAGFWHPTPSDEIIITKIKGKLNLLTTQ